MEAREFFRSLIGAVAVCLTASAASAQTVAGPETLSWGTNPFSLTLGDEVFPATTEYRFEKAQRVFVESMSGIGDELFDIASFPLRDPMTFGAYALGVAALTLVDRPTTMLYQEYVAPIGTRINPPHLIDTSQFGFLPNISKDEQYLAAGLIGSYAYGIAANDERAQVAALLSTKAVAYSFVTSHVLLKAGFGRMRPVPDLKGHRGPTGDYSTSPFDWFQSTGFHIDSETHGTAMPSFHFTMYFSTARIYSGVYDNYLIPYGLAALLAIQSAEGHNHWTSDMVAGALIGTGIGNVILNNYEERKLGPSGTVFPIVSSQGAGLGFQMNF
ncbi:MAG TPA: phosphatase PAP2 family protein [Rhodobacterales bacterium]|nr:phosphatase PAP2 family protein [Rhodobacterales bacterium]